MAGLGKILKKIDPGQKLYERDKVKYEKLSQDPHDNEAEDDDVVFSQDGVVTNGHADTSLSNGHHQNGVHLKRAKILKNSSDVEVKVKKLRILTKYRALCFCCVILVVLAGALFFALLWPFISKSSKHIVVPHRNMSTSDWTHVFDNTMTESCIRAYDVDGDGRDDVILGMENADRIMVAMQLEHKEDMEHFCHLQGESVPCMGQVVALRGYDGALLWSFPVYGTVFELNCGKIDVNKDGRMDCIGTGRVGTTVAFDPKNGNVLWSEDLDVLGETWNTYQVLVLPDLTNDGVAEVLLPNGGDPKFAPQEHVRYAGRLILLDGATGKHIGRALELVDAYGEKETYMSPVMHTTKNGSMYILYGSGGETVKGSFYGISLPDFYRHVNQLARGAQVPDTIRNGDYRDFPDHSRSREGIFSIYNSSTVGVMVPPVLVDMDADGVKDILMSAYDGTLALFNGATLKLMWAREFSGYESYSTPAPGYLNDDEVPDFMFHTNRGAWDKGYKYSLTIALDGKTGDTIMSINSSRYEMTSDLVARTTEQHRDAFIFRIQRSVHGQEERKKRQLFNRQFPSSSRRRQQPEPPNPYGYGDRYNRYNTGYPSQQQAPESDDEPYTGYGSSAYTGNGVGNGGYPSSPYMGGRGSAVAPGSMGQYGVANGGMYRSQAAYPQQQQPRGFGLDATGFQGYPSSRGSARLGYDVGSDDDEGVGGSDVFDDPRSYYYDPDSLSSFPGLGTGLDFEDEAESSFDSSDIERPQVFHPEPGEMLNGNRQCISSERLMRVTEIYMVDRSTLRAPIRLFTLPADRYYYNLTKDEIELARTQRMESQGGGGRERRHGSPGADNDDEEEEYMGDSEGGRLTLLEDEDEMCSVLTTSERNTGVLGDFDGDGDLDLIYAFELAGQKHDKFGSDFKSLGMVKVMKFDLKDAIKAGSQQHVELGVVVDESKMGMRGKVGVKGKGDGDREKGLQDVGFKGSGEQLWTGYLGANGDSIYGPA